MENPRWWHAAVGAISVVLTAMILLGDLALWQQVGAQAALTLFAVSWYTIGWRALLGNVPLGLVFTAIVIVSTGAATAFQPFMAIMQCVSYPLVWVVAKDLRTALWANVTLALAVGVGFLISTSDPVQTVLTIGLSLGVSLAIGLWITQIEIVSDQRQTLVDELRTAQDQIAMLNRDAGVTGERERLAREIHDTIAQDLTGLVMLAERTRRELDSGSTDAAANHLEALEDGARAALAETRSLVAASAPIGLAGGGIAEALKRLGERFERETGIVVTMSTVEFDGVYRDGEVVLLRCAQEGLANVRKHSGASAASIALSTRGGMARLTVSDDGDGFDPSAPSEGFGLPGMRERLALVSGSLRVSSSQGSGTVLEVELPIGVIA